LLGWLGVPRTPGNATGGGPEARVPWGILPEAGRRPAYSGEFYRMRAGGPRTLGNTTGGGPEARVPRGILPDAGRRPAYL